MSIEAFRVELTNMPGFPAESIRVLTVKYKVDGEWRFFNHEVPPHPAHWESELDLLFRYALDALKDMERGRYESTTEPWRLKGNPE